jgi:hypothetical protein
MADLETDVVTALNTTAYKAYFAQKPQSAALPCLVYQRITTGLQYGHAGATDLSVIRMQITAHAATYAAAKTAASATRAKMASTTSFKSFLDDQTEYIDENGINSIVHDYLIWTKKE